MTLVDGRKIKLHDCREEGSSLFGKLPNGAEIELIGRTEVSEEEFRQATRALQGTA